jgi:hypothetical protein
MLMAWTCFFDMHSGGGNKEPWERIFIEAPEQEAKVVFYNRFGHNPSRVTCTCCGEDYSIDESETLEKATAYARGVGSNYRTEVALEEYGKRKDVLIIDKESIHPDEYVGEVPDQGYVWAG